MTAVDISERIERFVRTQFRVAPTDTRFSRTQPLFESGYVDSIGVVELLAFISEEFGVSVPDDVLMSEEFATIDGIASVAYRLHQNGNGKDGASPL
jgi:acyl carrier protein